MNVLRVIKVKDALNTVNWRLKETFGYRDYYIYESGTYGEYLLYNPMDRVVVVIHSFNNIRWYEEILDAIDFKQDRGAFGFKAFEKDYLCNVPCDEMYLVHPSGDVQI